MNNALFELAQRRVWRDAGGPAMEKVAAVPPPGVDPAAAGGAMPPMDPAMMGGAMPPMDPAAAGAAGGAMPPMDPAMMGGAMPGAAPAMPGAAPAATGAAPAAPAAPGAPQAGQKMKPEQYMQMLDVRLYNLQQQVTALLNAQGVKLDPAVLIPPPGSPMGIPAEAAIQGGPSDPAQHQSNGGGGGGSAIGPIEPIQGASPEMASGGGEKTASFADLLEKLATSDLPTGPRSSSAPKPLPGGHPGRRPGTQAISAGGSKDPESRPETGADMGPVNKQAEDISSIFARNDVASNAAAVARMLRQATGKS